MQRNILLPLSYLLLQSLRKRKSPSFARKIYTSFDSYIRNMSESLFKTRHRVSKRLFKKILKNLQGKVRVGKVRKQRKYLEVSLSLSLRFLGGSKMSDLSELYGLSSSECFKRFWVTIDAIVDMYKLPNLFSPANFAEQAASFEKKSYRRVLIGCIGAVDGLIIQTKRPVAKDTKKYFTDRYHMFGLNVQAACNADRKFTFCAVQCGAATHDAKAIAFSSFKEKAESLPSNYWIAGDAAYKAIRGVIVPHPKGCSSEEDNFNFFLSQLRINIECAFGIFKARWGIFWRPQVIPLEKVPKIVLAAMLLHNMIIDDRDVDSYENVWDDTKRGLIDVANELRLRNASMPAVYTPPPSTSPMEGCTFVPPRSRVSWRRIMRQTKLRSNTVQPNVPRYHLPERREDTREILTSAVTTAGFRRPKKRGRVAEAILRVQKRRVLGEINN